MGRKSSIANPLLPVPLDVAPTPTKALDPYRRFYIRTLTYYNITNRDLKRLDAITRSPIFSLFSESLNGMSSIRAFKKETFYTRRIADMIDM